MHEQLTKVSVSVRRNYKNSSLTKPNQQSVSSLEIEAVKLGVSVGGKEQGQ